MVEVVNTGGKKPLVLDRNYPEDEAGQEENVERDTFSPLLSLSGKIWITLSTDPLDWALYDHLADFPAGEWVELSTALEHQEHSAFLEDHRRFVRSW